MISFCTLLPCALEFHMERKRAEAGFKKRRLEISSQKVQVALQELASKKLIEEVVGVSGTKYYLTDFGKKFCREKGILKT